MAALAMGELQTLTRFHLKELEGDSKGSGVIPQRVWGSRRPEEGCPSPAVVRTHSLYCSVHLPSAGPWLGSGRVAGGTQACPGGSTFQGSLAGRCWGAAGGGGLWVELSSGPQPRRTDLDTTTHEALPGAFSGF